MLGVDVDVKLTETHTEIKPNIWFWKLQKDTLNYTQTQEMWPNVFLWYLMDGWMDGIMGRVCTKAAYG